ncbi:MAG: methylenetetrahydrofolate reductase [NAD(P)H] [Porticoccaceae bacterium]|nr:methylenetetrahydrofolate reductase [NAD(P)H] [Porticoccaceae bacterium]
MSKVLPISFEFFPPKTEAGKEKLVTVHSELAALAPEFFSVTYGAGGSTRSNTRDTVLGIKAAGSDVAPHLSFGGDDETGVLELLNSYRDAGIRRIVALRGDLPSGMGRAAQLVHANELVEFIRKHFGDHFTVHVAAYPEIHPEAASYKDDVHWLKEKFNAGANSAITQYFFNPDAYFHFVNECHKQGVDQPIIPGIMPITNFTSLQRFSANCGAEVPRWMVQKLKSYEDNSESMVAAGVEIITALCEKLVVGGAPGLHFYTMNQINPTSAIVRNLCG